jgi:hypothetical protein
VNDHQSSIPNREKFRRLVYGVPGIFINGPWARLGVAIGYGGGWKWQLQECRTVVGGVSLEAQNNVFEA